MVCPSLASCLCDTCRIKKDLKHNIQHNLYALNDECSCECSVCETHCFVSNEKIRMTTKILADKAERQKLGIVDASPHEVVK